MAEKIGWRGEIVGVQPRIRLLRSFDQRSHTYLGYVLQIRGEVGGVERAFFVAIGKGAQAKHRFQAGCVVSGLCAPVPDSRLEAAEFYKTSGKQGAKGIHWQRRR